MTASESNKKRPGGFIILSIFMVWLSIAGLLNAWSILDGSYSEIPVVLGIIALIYGVTAGVVAFALWRFQLWALLALRIWMGVCCLFILAFMLFFSGMVLGSLPGFIGLFVFIGVLFAIMDRYVQGKFELHNES